MQCVSILNTVQRTELGQFKNLHPFSEELLNELYWSQNLSLSQIARKFNVSTTLILYKMKQKGVPRRNFSQSHMGNVPWNKGKNCRRILLNPEELQKLYWQKKISLQKIAEKFGCCEQTVETAMKENGIPIRHGSEAHKYKKVKKHSAETKRRMSEIAKAKLYWRHDFHRRPTKPEAIFSRIINQIENSEFRYVGDGTFWIGNVNPDFVDNYAKIAIFIDGCYWHHCPLHFPSSKTRISDDKANETLRNKGWQVIRFWEHEMKQPNADKFVFTRLQRGRTA